MRWSRSGFVVLAFCVAGDPASSPATVPDGPLPGSLRLSEPGAAPGSPRLPAPLFLAQRRSCKSVASCREAVILWCGGYRRADGDSDGIPCENVCRSRAEVDAIRREIGC